MQKETRTEAGIVELVGALNNSTVNIPKPVPKKHRARVYMLSTGIEGWTENDILRHCRLASGRNYGCELERKLGIALERIDEKNPDGVGSHFRYRFKCREDVERVVRLVNVHSAIGKYPSLSPREVSDILSLYPATNNAE